MDPDEIKVIDNRFRIQNPSLEKALKEHSEENLKRAEEKEKALHEKNNKIKKKIFNAIEKIKKTNSKNKKAIKLKAQNKER